MREYEVTIGGLQHTLQLDDADAARYGDQARPVETKQAPASKNKARTVKNKAGDSDDTDA